MQPSLLPSKHAGLPAFGAYLATVKLVPVFLLLLAIIGCSTVPPESQLAANEKLCYVCAYNNDLACLNIKPTSHTPTADYEGHTYYFCSETCHRDFLKNPARYAKLRH